MKIWFDCEFQEDGRIIDLISIGLVRADGEEYYAECSEYNENRATPWLRENVLPQLSGKIVDGRLKSRGHIRRDLLDFCGENPEFWGWYGSYDWVCLCQIFGTMMDLPNGWPMFIRDAMQIRDDARNDWLPPRARDEIEHHALGDARWQRRVYEYLTQSQFALPWIDPNTGYPVHGPLHRET